MIEENINFLKPMTVSEILDNTFRTYRDNFVAIMVFSAIIGGFFALLLSFVTQQSMVPGMPLVQWDELLQNPNMIPDMEANMNYEEFLPQLFMFQGIIFLLSMVSAIFINPLIQGGIINITYHDVIGKKLDYKEALTSTLKKYWQLVLTGLSLIPYYIAMVIVIIIVTIIMVIPLVLLGIGMSGDPTGGKIALFVLMLLLFIAGIIILSILSNIFIVFTYHVAMIEKSYNFGAIGRSFKLVAKKFWRVIGINFLILLIVGIIGGILTFISGITSIVSPNSFISTYAITFLMSAFIAPISLIATTLLFTDVKARVESIEI
ncbi:MAG TPA: hypothetical protein VFD57_03115 [Clostridia bacterium]|nr:hypothetical protein [Clostridia bacterium]